MIHEYTVFWNTFTCAGLVFLFLFSLAFSNYSFYFWWGRVVFHVTISMPVQLCDMFQLNGLIGQLYYSNVVKV